MVSFGDEVYFVGPSGKTSGRVVGEHVLVQDGEGRVHSIEAGSVFADESDVAGGVDIDDLIDDVFDIVGDVVSEVVSALWTL